MLILACHVTQTSTNLHNQKGWRTLKRVAWYFEDGGGVLQGGRCCTLNKVMFYFEDVSVTFIRCCGTLKKRLVL